MDFILDILVSQNDLKRLGLSEILIEWGGEFFSQDPPKYLTDSNLVFIQNKDMKYYESFMGKNLNIEGCIALTLGYTHIADLERLVNYDEANLWNNEVILFLSTLSKMEKFIIIMLREEEFIDKRYKVDEADEIISLICNGLKRDVSEGVIVEKIK